MTAKDIDTRKQNEDKSSVPGSAQTANATMELEKTEHALKQKAKEAKEAHEQYVRTYADFENYRKRMQRDVADFRKYAKEQMGEDLLGVVDHLGLAVRHAGETGEAGHRMREGIELVYKQLLGVLAKFGIKPFPAEGERFDPGKHDAVMQEFRDDLPENTVVRVLQEGYVYHDKVLRHAKVSLSRYAKAGAGNDETKEELNKPLDET